MGATLITLVCTPNIIPINTVTNCCVNVTTDSTFNFVPNDGNITLLVDGTIVVNTVVAGSGPTYPPLHQCWNLQLGAQGSYTITANYTGIFPTAQTSITVFTETGSTVVGDLISFNATVHEADSSGAIGTITFTLYDNPDRNGAPLFSDSESLVDGFAQAKNYTTVLAETVYWFFNFTGSGVDSGQFGSRGPFAYQILKASPSISGTPSPTITTVNGLISDEAHVTGGYNPSGTVTFNLFDNPNANGNSLFTNTQNLAGGAATSASYTATTAGTFYWVATYNGDVNNIGISTANNAQSVTVQKLTPSISGTQQPASAVVGGSIADKATVSGGDAPTGNVTFALYNNPSGQLSPLFNSNVEPLTGGVATSNSYTTQATGTFYWIATYLGDANNNQVSTDGGLQPVTITKATPHISAAPNNGAPTVGASIFVTSTVTGFNPTGTVTFLLYNNSNAEGTPLYNNTQALVSGSCTSGSYTTLNTQTVYWVATYNGDNNNFGNISTVSSAHPVIIRQASPSITDSPQPSTIDVGGSTFDKATVTGGDNPTGTVTFVLYASDGTTVLFTDTEALISGMATSQSYTPSGPGTYYWVATYNGDENNHVAKTTATPVTGQTVTVLNVPTTSLALTASPSDSQSYAQSITLTANVTSATPGVITGSVTFSADVLPGWTSQNTAPVLASGIAAIAIPQSILNQFPVGNAVFTAKFQSTSNYGNSSNTLAYFITATTNLTFTCDSAVVACNHQKTYNSSFTIIALVVASDNRPTALRGNVQFSWHNNSIGAAVAVVNGSATLVVNSSLGFPWPFAPGAQTFHAQFTGSGDGYLDSGANLSLTFRVPVVISVWNLAVFLDRTPTEYALPTHTARTNDMIVVEVDTIVPTAATFHLYAQLYPLNKNPLKLVTSAVAKKNDKLVNFTLPWGLAQVGEYHMTVNVTADKSHLAGTLGFRMLFHVFPSTGRYVLPEVEVTKGAHLTYYSKTWTTLNHYPLAKNGKKFSGWTSFHSSILKCNYTQVLDFSTTATSSKETYQFLGIPLLAGKLRTDGAGQFKSSIQKFAVMQVKVSEAQIGKQLSTLPDGPLASGTIYGTYCISLQRFPGFR